MQLALQVVKGPDSGQVMPWPEVTGGIGDRVAVIGRSPKIEFPLGDKNASRQHARFVADGHSGGVTVEDLGSANGTYVNGTRIEGVVTLQLGDRVGVGSTLAELIDADAAAGDVEKQTTDKVAAVADVADRGASAQATVTAANPAALAGRPTERLAPDAVPGAGSVQPAAKPVEAAGNEGDEEDIALRPRVEDGERVAPSTVAAAATAAVTATEPLKQSANDDEIEVRLGAGAALVRERKQGWIARVLPDWGILTGDVAGQGLLTQIVLGVALVGVLAGFFLAGMWLTGGCETETLRRGR